MIKDYMYKCEDEDCGHIEDFPFDIDEERPKRKKCPECGKMSMHRVFGGAITIPFQFHKDSYNFDQRPSKKKQYY